MTSKNETDIKILLGQIITKQETSQAQIKELDGKVDIILTERIPALHVDLAMLKVRSGLWGMIAGAVPVLTQYLLQHT